MRRLIGLIALVALVLGALWLTQNDFDLRRVPGIGAYLEPPRQDDQSAARTNARAQVPEASDAASGRVGEAAPMPEASTPRAAAGADTAGARDAPDAAAAGRTASSETAALEPSSPGAEAPGATETPAAGTELPMAEPPAAGAAAPVGIVPSFDLVRVEPSGETVIAGLAAPRAKVEVLDGTDPVATAEANERGEWALALDQPLPPGTHDLAVRTTTADGSKVTLSDQRVAVAVPADGDEQALVVLNQPDGPSRVMQLPAEPDGAPAPEIAAASGSPPEAAAEPATPPAAAETSSAETAADGEPPTTEMAAAPQAESTEATPAPLAEAGPGPGETPVPETPAADSELAAAPEPEAMAEAAPPSDVPPAAPPAAGEAAPAGTATAPAASAAGREIAALPEPQTTTDLSVPPDDTDMAAEPGEAEPEPAPPGMETASMAPEADGDVSGAAEPQAMAAPPAASRPEAAEVPAADAAAPAGMPPQASSAPDVAAVVELEAQAAPPGSGGAGESSPAAESEPAEPSAEREPPAPAASVGIAAIEAETNGALYVAGTAATPETVRVYIDGEFVGEAVPGESGTWLLETMRELAPNEYMIRVDQVDASTGAVLARAEVPFRREIEIAVLRQSGTAVAAGDAEVSGSLAGPKQVIIKRGDNLWRISREIYGRGIRFSTIYQANRDQIRNPNLIYPGQVFVLPAGNSAWETQQ